jgi:hypothetical protein
MKRASIFSLLAALSLLAAPPAFAQSWTSYKPASTLFTFGYQMAQGIGQMHDYINNGSFRGATFDWRSMLGKDFSAGLRFNWNRFDQTYSQLTITTQTGGTLSGPVFRYADQFTVQAIGHYYLSLGSDVFIPFLGVGVGGVWSSSYQQTADLAASQGGFYFITSPEAGLLVMLAKGSVNVGLIGAVMYNFTTISFRNVSNAQWLAESISLAFTY